MRIMGLGDMVHLWSWAIISLIFNLTSILLITAIIKFGRVLPNVDFSLLFVFLALFAISSIALCLLISTFFSNANISTAATCMIYFLFFFPFQISIKARNKTFTHITLIFPQTTLGYGAAMISLYDEINKAKWKNIDEIYLEAYDVSLLECMVAFICEAIVFVILTWYKSAVSPGIYGVSLPWYFFLTRRYWLPSAVDVADFNPITDSQPAPSSNNFDAEPTDLPLTVNISGLSKVYSNGTKALDNLCLNLYEDQITALLGHNGAGKTTTMSILCGLYSPSNGTASIYGMDIRKEILSVREVLGVCPQYNVLFSHLTVAEQLKLFAALKGTPDAKIEQEVEEILNAVSLMDKKRELASALSGGMKRRLCIGIALIGGSRFVILDEPTAGVDVMSRKEIWTLLQNNKKGRTILLSTHHMDEADILSDRIAILSEGKLISLGSSIFLKNRYGESFQVVACKEDRTHDYTSIVTSIVTEATIAIRLVDHTEDELVFSIPISTNSVKLESFFANFDSKKKAYMIAEYGISAPTLQEIFVRLCPHREYIVPVHKAGILSKMKKKIRRNAVQNDQQQLVKLPVLDEDAADAGAPKDDSPQLYDEGDIPVLLSGWRLRFTHIKALLNCRWRYTIRSKKLILFEVVLPILLLFYCELYAKIQYGGEKPPSTYQPPLPLVAELFGNDTNAYVSLWDRNPESLSYQIMHSLVEPPDMGTRCVNNVPVIRRRMGVGCNREAGNGTFNWNVNRSTIPYNENVACQCTEHHVWNCTLEDYPFERIPNLTLNSTVKLWDMSYRNISQMRMVSRWSRNETSEIALVLGGLSLGHTSVRARTPPEVVSEIEGWQNFVAGLNRSAAALNINVTKSESPSIYDPFLKNMTTLDFITGVVKSMETKENVKAWFNNKLYTSLPTFVGILSNALLRVESKGLDPSNLGIITINHPMNQTLRDNFDNEASGKLVVFRITLIMLVLCVIPAGFTVFLVEERVCDAFHLQLVSGLSRLTYWITGYAFDMSVYTISIIAVLMIYVIFGVQDFAYSFGSLGSFFLVFFLHGLCAVLWAYIFQRRFQVPALSFVLISVGTFFVGIVAVLTVVIIEQLMQEDRTLLATHGICSTVFLMIPPYNLGMAIFRGVVVSRLAEIGENFLRELNRLDLLSSLPIPSLLEWSLMGIHCFCLIIHITIAAVILCIIEGEPFEFLR
ncbi:hypothetical protein KIN20_014057 [Parelaphostrongylus tenuis]|uniref:ABC transporter domain-containing protein n=1 Tax=Parelaphostrongylus tenuis TaxID=148309 RepID=A0AAD5MYF4_PARTN|nr:hypothetical protein KIN20_014057 [Parelaphostrongylus tenuis]